MDGSDPRADPGRKTLAALPASLSSPFSRERWRRRRKRDVRQLRKCDASPDAGVQCRCRFPSCLHSRWSGFADDAPWIWASRTSNLQGHFHLPAKDAVQMCASVPLLPQVDMYHVFLHGLEKACFSHDDVQSEQVRQ